MVSYYGTIKIPTRSCNSVFPPFFTDFIDTKQHIRNDFLIGRKATRHPFNYSYHVIHHITMRNITINKTPAGVGLLNKAFQVLDQFTPDNPTVVLLIPWFPRTHILNCCIILWNDNSRDRKFGWWPYPPN